jgi:hypothetical protein
MKALTNLEQIKLVKQQLTQKGKEETCVDVMIKYSTNVLEDEDTYPNCTIERKTLSLNSNKGKDELSHWCWFYKS